MKLPFRKKKEKEREEEILDIAPKPLLRMFEEPNRLALGVYGPPGSGKTTLLKASMRIAEALGIEHVYIGVKWQKGVISVSEKNVLRWIVDVLHVTSRTNIMPSLDMLGFYATTVSNLEELENIVDTKLTDRRVADYLRLRVQYLISLKQGDKIVLDLSNVTNEFQRRLAIGLLTPWRAENPTALVFIDDAVTVMFDQEMLFQYLAVQRPFAAAFNYLPDVRNLSQTKPSIVTPCNAPFHRYCSPRHYVVLMNGKPIEKIRADDVLLLANS